jgi:hypothetical protein
MESFIMGKNGNGRRFPNSNFVTLQAAGLLRRGNQALALDPSQSASARGEWLSHTSSLIKGHSISHIDLKA